MALRFIFALAALTFSTGLQAQPAFNNAELQVLYGPQIFSGFLNGRSTVTVNFALNPPAEAPLLTYSDRQ